MEIKQINIDKLIQYEKNTKKHPEEQIEKIAKSIKEFGFNVPVIIDKENIIIAGHARLISAKKLGLKEIPVIVKEKLTPAQIKAYRIADNKTAESEWDFEFLKDEITDLKNINYDLKLTGFSEDEITDFELFKNDKFQKQEFSKLIDEFSEEGGKCEKNENWFYIEFYKEDEKFKELLELLEEMFVNKGKHELSGEWFYNLIKGKE